MTAYLTNDKGVINDEEMTHEEYLQRLKQLGPKIKELDATPLKIAERIIVPRKPGKYAHLADLVKFPEAIKDYQRQLINDTFVKYDGRVYYAVEMGGGKTLPTLGVLSVSPTPVLFICPPDKCLDIQEEAKKWYGMDYTIFKTGCKPVGKYVIVQYGLVEQVANYPWRSIAVDEAHNLKNPASKRCKSIMPMVQRAEIAVLLSGTPIKSCYSELWSQLNMLSKTVNYYEFTKRYCNASKTHFGWQMGKSRYHEEVSMLFDTYAIVLLKEDLNLNLPDLERKEIKFEISEENQKEFEKMFVELERLKSIEAEMEINVLVGRMVMLSAYAILDKSIELIKNEAQTNQETFIVFAYNKDILKRVASSLNEIGISNIIVDGDVSKKRKHELITELRKGKYRVGLLSFCCSTGINLQPIKKTYYIQRVWTSSEMDQADSRTHRMGAKETVECIYLTGIGTYDHRQMTKLDRKSQLVGNIMKSNKRFKMS